MSGTDWQISGEYMESCNCDYLCPCIYTNPQGEVTLRPLHRRADLPHRQGAARRHRSVDGLCFALVIRSGKIMADGNWIFAGVVDERADAAQRAALSAIVSGEAGGTPGMIRTNLVSDFRGVEFKPIEFKMEGSEALGLDPRHPVVRNRRRRVAQPQRRAVLHRQHRASRQPPPGARPRGATACAWLRPRTRHGRQRQQRALRAVRLGGLERAWRARAQLLRRDRVVIVLALAGVTAIAWLYLVPSPAQAAWTWPMQAMADMPEHDDAVRRPWSSPCGGS